MVPCYGSFTQAQATIKVGVLHSLSGTMAISETVLNWPLFAEKAKQLISQDKVAVVFGCWTGVTRKSVLPVFEQTNSLLFHPVQYEGE